MFDRRPTGLGGGDPRLPAVWRDAGVRGALDPNEDTPSVPTRSTARAQRLEAVLWLATEPLTPQRLSRMAGLKGPGEAKKLLQELHRRLAARRSALAITEVAGGFRLMTRPAYAPWIERREGLENVSANGPKLSPAAGETLAIVAYRQPTVRAEVESIRGVGCGDILRQLLELDLLRIVGRSEELGKPLLYGTTGRFLEVYGLGSLDDLPGRNEGAENAGPTKQNAATSGAA
ncbi:hypothetical protein MalM25_38010 [Planctomycetes bacterium MalM25]|nr:hypothetical protein MalM25_38010 [Planctomycetes bacterium MalM25]